MSQIPALHHKGGRLPGVAVVVERDGIDAAYLFILINDISRDLLAEDFVKNCGRRLS